MNSFSPLWGAVRPKVVGRKWIKGGAWKTGHPVSRTIEADTSDRRDNAVDHS